MKTRKQYLIVDTKKYRRHSAPENLGLWFASEPGNSLLEREYWCRASVSDFSVLLENQSESGSSLELDTSNLSRDLSPVPTTKTSPRDSYQNLPIDFETSRRNEDEPSWHGLSSWPMWRNIILSQAIAGCLAVMDISNGSLKDNSGALVTNGQNLPHYILLSVLFTTRLAIRNDGRDIVEVIRYSGLRYLLLSIFHVEANYLLLSSFHHNTYLGNQMIDSLAASLSLVLAYVFLEVQFHLVHVSGFAFTLVGATGLFIADAIHKNQNHDDVLLGDVLRVASGLCLAFNSTAQEIIIKSIDFVEYMGMIGLIGSLICGFQAIALETNKIIPRNSSYWMNMLSYSAAQFFMNSLIPRVLRETGATGLHLALTSSGFYSYFFRVMCHREKLQILYLFAFAVSATGLLLFSVKRTIIGTQTFFPVKVILIKGS